jgi:hypothetical protein
VELELASFGVTVLGSNWDMDVAMVKDKEHDLIPCDYERTTKIAHECGSSPLPCLNNFTLSSCRTTSRAQRVPQHISIPSAFAILSPIKFVFASSSPFLISLTITVPFQKFTSWISCSFFRKPHCHSTMSLWRAARRSKLQNIQK